jgi:hypothetical protein
MVSKTRMYQLFLEPTFKKASQRAASGCCRSQSVRAVHEDHVSKIDTGGGRLDPAAACIRMPASQGGLRALGPGEAGQSTDRGWELACAL